MQGKEDLVILLGGVVSICLLTDANDGAAGVAITSTRNRPRKFGTCAAGSASFVLDEDNVLLFPKMNNTENKKVLLMLKQEIFT